MRGFKCRFVSDGAIWGGLGQMPWRRALLTQRRENFCLSVNGRFYFAEELSNFSVMYPPQTRLNVVNQHSAPNTHAIHANHAGNRQPNTKSKMVSVPSVSPPR